MAQYCEQYLRENFDDFLFFVPGCRDKRFREINMRTKFCLQCKGFEACKMHPLYWLEGEAQRQVENDRLVAETAGE